MYLTNMLHNICDVKRTYFIHVFGLNIHIYGISQIICVTERRRIIPFTYNIYVVVLYLFMKWEIEYYGIILPCEALMRRRLTVEISH